MSDNNSDNKRKAVIIQIINPKLKFYDRTEFLGLAASANYEIIDYIIQKTKSRSEVLFGAKAYRPNEIMFLGGNNQSAQKTLNWTPQYSLYEGLDETIEYFRSLM